MRAVQAAFPPGIKRSLDGLSALVHSVGGGEYWLVQTGMGLEKARRSASRLLLQQSIDLVVSTGFTCSLVDAEIGALLVGFEVVQRMDDCSEATQSLALRDKERSLAVAVIQTLVPSERIGCFVSTDHVIGSAREKREIAKSTAAIGLDMESSALAREAERAHVPFVIIRSVSDLLDEDLPLDFNLFLKPTGWLTGIATVLTTPSSLLGLGRLRRQSRIAAQNLTEFFRHYATAMAAQTRPGELSRT